MIDSAAYDVIVIGAGPAGIAAATTAAEQGLGVLIVDESPRPGGNIWRHVSRHSMAGNAKHWLHRLESSKAKLSSSSTVVDVERDTTGASSNGFVVTIAGVHAGRFTTRFIVIATGARERFLPFPGWTLPGVVGIGGAQALLKSGASMRGRKVVIAGSGPLMLPVAASLSNGEATVTHVVEQAPAARIARFASSLWRSPSRIAQAVTYRAQASGARWMTGAWVATAEGTESVRAVVITNGVKTMTVPCDMLCTGYGLVPSTEVARLAGCEIRDGGVKVDSSQRTSIDGIYCAGEPNGVAGVDAAVAEGCIAALSIAGSATNRSAVRAYQRIAAKERAFAHRIDVAYEIRSELRQLATPDTIVCRCEDVTLGAITRCESMREAKLHTRAGMGPCQGRVCSPAMELLFNWSESTVRPPLMPAPVSTFINDNAAHSGGAT